MAWRYDSWESYFYPETINPVTGDGTLRNLYDERDPRVLARFEYIETTGRATELLRGDVAVPRTYDAEHVRAIHRHLFQDVYEWAGLRELLRQMHHSPVPCERSEARIAEMTPA